MQEFISRIALVDSLVASVSELWWIGGADLKTGTQNNVIY